MSSANVTVKMAQSASALGAGLLGFAIGGKWGYIINNTILVITLSVGAVLHVYGMYIIQMKKENKLTGPIAKTLWLTAWVCLLALILVFIYFLIYR
jgi:hypothetical protein